MAFCVFEPNKPHWLGLRTFFEKVSFWKMGVAGIKWGPYPSTIHSFSINLNEEALLKVSLKNIDSFKVAHFPKPLFFKKGPKSPKFFEKLEFFFQAEDGIRDFCLSRGLGDVYKRQAISWSFLVQISKFLFEQKRHTIFHLNLTC